MLALVYSHCTRVCYVLGKAAMGYIIDLGTELRGLMSARLCVLQHSQLGLIAHCVRGPISRGEHGCNVHTKINVRVDQTY